MKMVPFPELGTLLGYLLQCGLGSYP